MGQRIVIVDAFTDRPFAGNPAAVCVLSGPADDAWMRALAREMNLSETAFLHPEGDAFRLRWFTPAVEVDLCGHATLASAHVLWEDGHIGLDEPARFQTRSGLLSASRDGDWINLDFPARPLHSTEVPPGLAEALGVPIRSGGLAGPYAIAEVIDEATVRRVAPDLRALAAIPALGVIVTARSALPDFDIVSRFFAPNAGIDEDPVTGSAHCTLGPHWADRLGKTELVAYQASARGGVVRVRLEADRAILGGRAVSVLRGELA